MYQILSQVPMNSPIYRNWNKNLATALAVRLLRNLVKSDTNLAFELWWYTINETMVSSIGYNIIILRQIMKKGMQDLL